MRENYSVYHDAGKGVPARISGVDLHRGYSEYSEHSDGAMREAAENESGGDLTNSEYLDSVLDNFREGNWSDLSLEDKKRSITDLADYAIADTGIENPPEIIFSTDMPDGTYGGYNPGSNTIEINVNMLDDSLEAADTITHEMWHAYQEQASKDPSNPRAGEYRDGFDNYISPEFDFEGYENQMVEAEARDYAQGFKDRIARR